MQTVAEQIDELACAGVTQTGIEAVLGRHLDASELVVFRHAQTVRRAEGRPVRQVRRASGPMTVAERVAAHRAGKRELGELRAVVDPLRRERCRLDLLEFGLTYCMTEYADDGETILVPRMLRRRPSERMERFVIDLQRTILNGGNRHVRWPRGKGKTTWVKIAILWCIAYGHHPFVVIVAATKAMAGEAASEIWTYCTEDRLFAEDFPEIAQPLADVALTPQRMRVQTYRGYKTHIRDNTDFSYKRFARLEGFPTTGTILAWRGADQAIRGLNIGSYRPTFVFIDDPQTDVSAKSPTQVAAIEGFITKALLNLGDTAKMISAVMASTPIEPDDVSERFANPELHPEWQTTTEKLVVEFGPKEWIDRYLAALVRDDLARDTMRKESRGFYLLHRAEIEAGAEMMDEQDFDPRSEVSAYQHALNRLHVMKPKAFYSELQMVPSRAQGVYKLDATLVSKRLNGLPGGVVPDACDQGALAFCDVNGVEGLRWGVMAFGRGRVTAVVAYGRFPERGRLYPEGTPESAVPQYLAAAMREVVTAIRTATLRTASGEPVKVRGICFDGGWQTATVASVCREMDTPACHCTWSKGFGAKEYSIYHHEKAASTEGARKGLKAGEMCHTWRSEENGVYLAFNADYWREIGQTQYMAAPLSQNSCSLWGDDPSAHWQWAQEVTAEELVAKDSHPKYGTVWLWRKKGPNHFGDVNYGCLAYGAIRGNFDPLGAVIASAQPAGTDGKPQAMPRPKRRRRVVYQYVR